MYKFKTKFKFMDNEKWYGGCVNDGINMPYFENKKAFDLETGNDSNQATSFFISTKGRYIYVNEPVEFEIKRNNLIISSNKEIKINECSNLKEAYLDAAKKHFNLTSNAPDMSMFSMPQYNTWIEMGYGVNEEKVLQYANGIIENGFKPGILMIDDSWQTDYGVWEFNRANFKNPKGMITKLHEMGFKIMLWVCPFISPDSELFREILSKGYLIKDASNPRKPKIIEWWDGFSGCIDFTNQEAMAWFTNCLKDLQTKYDIDGFKFDAADFYFYENCKFAKGSSQAGQAFKFNELGKEFPFNEFRVAFNNQGQNNIQRLNDKNHSWENCGLNMLIPNGLAASILGYRFICPDMIGGGMLPDFQKKDFKFDQELFVRYAQVATFFPMLQFSILPWKVLSEENLQLIKECMSLHEKLVPYIEQLVNESLKSGEPIIRPIEYEYPNCGFDEVKDMFMLGDKYIIAPCLTKNKGHRIVKLPEGFWKDDEENIFKGNKNVAISTALNRIPYFEKCVSIENIKEEPVKKKSRKRKGAE